MKAGAGRPCYVKPTRRLWIDEQRSPDRRLMFRGAFELPRDAEVELRPSGASWFVAHLDGEVLAEGPNRFDAAHPEYIAIRKPLAKGRHLLAAMVIDEGVATKRMPSMAAFFAADVLLDDKPLPIDWRCRAVAGHRAQTRRINGDLGWIDWLDTRAVPADWRRVEFDDSSWARPKPTDVKFADAAASDIGAVPQWPHKLTPIGHGFAADAF